MCKDVGGHYETRRGGGVEEKLGCNRMKISKRILAMRVYVLERFIDTEWPYTWEVLILHSRLLFLTLET